MKNIPVQKVTELIQDLCIQACHDVNPDISQAFKNASAREESSIGAATLDQLLKNTEIATDKQIPICQDTGFTVIFMEIGQEIHFSGGSLKDAINEGVRRGYRDGYLRKSIIDNPLTHPVNTQDNTPAVIHTEIVPGSSVKITVLPKGGGSENAGRIKMLTPADGVEGVKQFVLDTVRETGADACPPLLIGVGFGGTFDYVGFLAKKALLRPIGQRNPDPDLAKLEIEWLEEVNKLGIGPGGFGGRVTALDLFLEVFPRHIAMFPVAVNIQCHAARSKTATL